MKNWYIVQSHSSFENKVAKIIKEEAEKAKASEKIEEIVVPTHDVTEVKRGKRIQRKKKYFPGYVLIKSEMDNDLYHMIKGIKKVISATRYHSLIIDKKSLSNELIITAETSDKIIMGVMHKKYNIHGVQFHPESIKTPVGMQILKNFLKIR